jgi:pectinesterase
MKNFSIVFLFIVFSITSLRGQDKLKFTVAKDSSGDFTSIQAAVDAARAFPDARITIYIKNGVYHEKVRVPACNNKLSFIGESAEKTIISYGDNFNSIKRGRNSTFYSYTLQIEADDFYAENITIENTSGAVGQAVTLDVQGDRCVFKNCRLLGNQDTLYAAGQNARQYFENCYIEGTTDFIFGAATAVFNKCNIFIKADSYFTAASTPQGKPFGFVFLHCKLTAKEGVKKAYLGRPWRDYANVVYLNCEMCPQIAPEGWANWDKTSRDKTAYFAEFENTGEGSKIDQRVGWCHQLTKAEAAKYTVENILSPVLPKEPAVMEWTNKMN